MLVVPDITPKRDDLLIFTSPPLWVTYAAKHSWPFSTAADYYVPNWIILCKSPVIPSNALPETSRFLSRFVLRHLNPCISPRHTTISLARNSAFWLPKSSSTHFLKSLIRREVLPLWLLSYNSWKPLSARCPLKLI